MNSKIELSTPRTLLRNLSPTDAKDFFALNLDPEVIRFTGDNPFNSLADSRRFLEEYDQYQKYGVGRLAVIEKASGEFLGWCGLKYCVEEDYYDLGYRFFRKYWGKGFATETALANLGFGFGEKGLDKIIGRALVENLASIRVLEKIGMKHEKYVDFDGKAGVVYGIDKRSYLVPTPILLK